jgi:hypothetical protein
MADNSKLHTALCHQVRDFIFLHGGYAEKNLGGIGTVKGRPDFNAWLPHPIFCLPNSTLHIPIALHIEIKTGTGELSEEQERVMREIVRRGGIYLEVRSLDGLEDDLYQLGLIRVRSLFK